MLVRTLDTKSLASLEDGSPAQNLAEYLASDYNHKHRAGAECIRQRIGLKKEKLACPSAARVTLKRCESGRCWGEDSDALLFLDRILPYCRVADSKTYTSRPLGKARTPDRGSSARLKGQHPASPRAT